MLNNLNIIDLFCGAGGLSLGFQEVGYNIVTSLDIDNYAIETYSFNIKTQKKPINRSLTKIDPKFLLDYIEMDVGELDLIIGGPPCKSFSNANRQNRSKNNHFNLLPFHYLNFIKGLKPKAFLLENVPGLKSFDKGYLFDDFINKIKKLKYIINHFTINCEEYGIPQKRERIFIIGTRKRKKFRFNSEKQKRVSVKEAINDLPILKNGNKNDPLPYKKNTRLSKYQMEMRELHNEEVVYNNLVTRNKDLIIERYRYITQGGNWQDIPENLMHNYSNLKNCHSSIYHRLNYNKPSKTICNFRKNMIIHPIQHRGLSVREAARIQSFPDNFIFKGGIQSQQQQVANAVPPKLSKLIANELQSYFNN
ncbi:MAG: DNA cytosine methyltransferase [Candidatus Thorarchaeota archaeon]